MIYGSTKTYTHSVGLSCAFRQWRAESHCKYIHGYALQVTLDFCGTPDEKGWIVDFGSLKGFKQILEDKFDHKLLVAYDDPHRIQLLQLQTAGVADVVEVPATGCERFAEYIFEGAEVWLKSNGYSPRVQIRKVEVREHQGNSAYIERPL